MSIIGENQKIIIDVDKLIDEISKTEAKLHALRKQYQQFELGKLSSVYKNGLAYGIAYNTGYRDEIEMLDIMDNQPDRLIPVAKKRAGDFLDEKLFIVGMQIVKTEKIISV